jgi:ribonuclease T2
VRLPLAAALTGAISAQVPAQAHAQALSCAVPREVPRPSPDLPDDRQPVRRLPIGSYTLAISWSPEYCRTARDRAASRFQCGGGSRFGFTLHGLWPDGVGKEWPQYCRPTAILPRATIRRNLCATPSAQLLQHEWAKHGTCMAGSTADRYFARSTAMYRALRFPDMDALSRRPALTVGALAEEVARANPGMRASMMRVTTTRQGWLDEIWLCADTRFRYRACPAHQGGAASSERLRIWRGPDGPR